MSLVPLFLAALCEMTILASNFKKMFGINEIQSEIVECLEPADKFRIFEWNMQFKKIYESDHSNECDKRRKFYQLSLFISAMTDEITAQEFYDYLHVHSGGTKPSK